MTTHSYHIFTFPFQWTIRGFKDKTFSEQINLENIRLGESPLWKRVSQKDILDARRSENLYNEHNYFYRFVQDALYDNGKHGRENLLRHYERVEPCNGDVEYHIQTNSKEYVLKVENIFLNIYSTGVGTLTFYLSNSRYHDFNDVLAINQYGRRVYPPFWADKLYHIESAKELCITGLTGTYQSDFDKYEPSDTNKPCALVTKMIKEVATNIDIETVIDDRMYVMSWVCDKKMAEDACKSYGPTNENALNDKAHKDWYRYVFVDAGEEPTCHNAGMFRQLLDKATYVRWQECNTLYGISRYSFVMLSNAGEAEKHLYTYFETEYVRMAELVLVQKASVLRFSQEVTNISTLDKSRNLAEKVDSLYKEYIRFVNQVHFREVSAQDQAIELYQLLYKQMDIENQVEKLDGEIDELHTYVDLSEERKKAKVMDLMSYAAALALPASIATGFYGMNNTTNGAVQGEANWTNDFTLQWASIVICVTIFLIIIYLYKNKKRK